MSKQEPKQPSQRPPVVEGPQTGVCNICGANGPLTRDHTPPKGALRIKPVRLRSLASNLSDVEGVWAQSKILQNGLQYRSLCGPCNNDILGINYDPEFISFVQQIDNYSTTDAALTKNVDIDVSPQKLMRAILGHLCAQGVDRYKKGPQTEPIRDYMLDNSLPLPSGIRIFAWPYPHERQIVARDAVCAVISLNANFMFWIMKFYPVSLLVTFDQPANHYLCLPELSIWRNRDIDHRAKLRMDFSRLQHQYWPEAPDDDTIIAMGREAVIVEPHRGKNKKGRK